MLTILIISQIILMKFIRTSQVLPFDSPTTASFQLQDLEHYSSRAHLCTESTSSLSNILLKYFKSGSDTFQAFPASDGSTDFPELPKVPFTRHPRHTGVPRPYGTNDCLKAIPDRWYFVMIYANKQPNGNCAFDVVYLDHDEQFSNLSCDGTESYFLDAYLGGMNVWEKGYNAYKPSTSWDSKQDEGVKVTTTAKDGIFKLSGSAEDLRFLSRKFILGFGGYVYRIRHNVDFAKVDILDIDSKYKNSNPNGTKN